MRICACIGSPGEAGGAAPADMVEIALSAFEESGAPPGKPVVLRFDADKDRVDREDLPAGFEGIVDIGARSAGDLRGVSVMSSRHDYNRTPSAAGIVGMLEGMGGDIAKCAFMVNRMSDLSNIHDAARLHKGRHVLIGMGELGAVTRVRGDVLRNEFNYAHTGTPTAPGQLSVGEMSKIGDGTMVVGLVGHPLSKSLSKGMHEAAMRRAGIDGVYLTFDTNSIDDIEDVVRKYGIRGMNVTRPFKKDIMKHLDSVDAEARRIGAVNTVVNDGGRLLGTNTDAYGVSSAFKRAGVGTASQKVLIMGSGGSARACASVFSEKSDVSVIARNRATAEDLCAAFGCELADSADPSRFDIVINCTPLGMYETGAYPIALDRLTPEQTVFDVTYGGDTPLEVAGRKAGSRLIDGTEMLVGQGMKSFELWTGVVPDYATMRGVVY